MVRQGSFTRMGWLLASCGLICAVSCRDFGDLPNTDSPIGRAGSAMSPTGEAGDHPGDGGLGGAGYGGSRGANTVGDSSLGGLDTSGDTAASGGDAGSSQTTVTLGADSPAEPSTFDDRSFEAPALGYYQYDNAAGYSLMCMSKDGGLASTEFDYCEQFGVPESRPFVLSSPARCGTHGAITEFAAVGVSIGDWWHVSPNNLVWEWGLDDLYDRHFGTDPWPGSWNGVLVGYEGGAFSVDWERNWWASGVRKLPFDPVTSDMDSPAFPIIGRWRIGYGQRLGVFKAGKFYLDWDGDNAWDASKDRIVNFGSPGVYPVAADFVPGGADELGTFLNGTWFIDLNGDDSWTSVEDGDAQISFGATGTLPVVARAGWKRECPQESN